jgi:Caudovirus prohead serine protease
MIEYKSQKAFTMGIEGRSVTGIFAVHGNVDSGDGWSSRDRGWPGMFGDFTVDGRKRAVFLWQHNSQEPPIATIDSLYEVAPADLPAAVKLYAPDATGGVAVKRTYLDTPRANEVLTALQAGALSEMSYAYDVTRSDTEDPPNGSRELPIRNIYAAQLYDISDVNWGMNPATSSDGTKALALAAHGDVVKATLSAYMERLTDLHDRRSKEGRVFSSANYQALKSLADELDASISSLRNLLSQSEPKQSADVQRLWMEVQQTFARLNGVTL